MQGPGVHEGGEKRQRVLLRVGDQLDWQSHLQRTESDELQTGADRQVVHESDFIRSEPAQGGFVV